MVDHERTKKKKKVKKEKKNLVYFFFYHTTHLSLDPIVYVRWLSFDRLLDLSFLPTFRYASSSLLFKVFVSFLLVLV